MKKHATAILEEAKLGLPPEEAQQAQERGEGLAIVRLSKELLKSQVLEE